MAGTRTSLTESMFYVLLALRSGPKFGVEISSYVDEKTKGETMLGPATLYTILGKFEKEKYIQEISVEARKRTYQLTAKGLKAYRDEVNRLRRLVADAESEGV